MRRAIIGCVLAFLVRPTPADACSHPFLCQTQVLSPSSPTVPTDAQIVAQVSTCSQDPASYLHLRRASDGVEIEVTVDSDSWNQDTTGITDDYLGTTAVRLTPTAPLEAGIEYELWSSTGSSGEPGQMEFSFSTGAAPFAGPAPGPLDVSLVADPPSADECGEAAICCGPMTLQAIHFAADPGLMYTITQSDGTVVAADVLGGSPGLVVCDGDDYLERTDDGQLWVLPRAHGSVTLTITARDIIGRQSPPTTVTFIACPDPDPDPDADPGSGGGCSATGPSGLLALMLVLLVARRRAGLHARFPSVEST